MAIVKKCIPTEHAEQVAFVQWWELTYPSIRIFAIPNGGYRHKKTACDLKKEGLKKGVPDLYIPELKLWIEMKRIKKGVLSVEQKDWQDYLLSIGDRHIIAMGAIDAISKVKIILTDKE